MSPVYSWPFIYTAPALCVASVLLLMQLSYLRKRFVFFDVRYFGVFEIYKHCNSVVICTSYCGTKGYVAESCNIKNLKNGLERSFFFFETSFLEDFHLFLMFAHATQVAFETLVQASSICPYLHFTAYNPFNTICF